MINIKWDKSYSVNNEKIDNEHRVFIDLVRSCSDAIDSHMDIDYVCRQLEELALYAKFHFFSEENLMINSKYPDYQKHKGEHIQLLETLEQKISYYREQREDGNLLIEFIFEWFVFHSMQTDNLLAKYLNTRSCFQASYQ